MFMSIKTYSYPKHFGTKNVPSSGMSLKFYKTPCSAASSHSWSTILWLLTKASVCHSTPTVCRYVTHMYVALHMTSYTSPMTIFCVVMLRFIQTFCVLYVEGCSRLSLWPINVIGPTIWERATAMSERDNVLVYSKHKHRFDSCLWILSNLLPTGCVIAGSSTKFCIDNDTQKDKYKRYLPICMYVYVCI
jgi:hypothetical protein